MVSLKYYLSSDESNGGSDYEPNNLNVKTVLNITKKKKRTRNWYPSNTYETKEEAVNAVKAETIWSYFYQSKTSQGNKFYYRCNAVKRRGRQCDAGLYILYCIDKTDVIIFRTEEGHSHEGLENNTFKLNDDIKSKIKSLFDLKVKPMSILRMLSRQGIELKKSQLSNYLTKLKHQTYDPSKISLNILEK